MSIIKYLSLVYVGVSQNATPLITVFMSFMMTGERLKRQDIVLLAITFVGVTLITIGFKKTKSMPDVIPMDARAGCFILPFLMSYGNVIMRKMNGMNEHTISCYLNPFYCLGSVIFIYVEQISWNPISRINALGWLVLIINTVISVAA